jgi:mRNA interferase MazF
MGSVRRGDLVTIAMQGDFGNPRPALVIQSDVFNATHATVTILPITSELIDAVIFRLTIEPSEANGLRKTSQIMVDKTMTVMVEKVGSAFGRLDDSCMVSVNRALAVFVGLA